ncbi:MAG: GNAT family N-acetyltransferase [Sphingomonadales bacterium]|nr:MAG: GNAT family N-acetyltransferase [Sphingomonadales bacterium]
MPATIRTFRDSDALALSALTQAAILTIGPLAYAPDQIAAWAARHPGPERFVASALKADMILVAVDANDTAVAYTLTEASGHCDMLYCHPDHAGQGLAIALLAETERWARNTGLARLFTEASELARPVFERAGFVVLHRRDFDIAHAGAAIPIHNYAMEKRLD